MDVMVNLGTASRSLEFICITKSILPFVYAQEVRMRCSKKNRSVIFLLAAFLAFSGTEGSARQIGFFSGTFDPIHGGHIELAAKAVKMLSLDIFYFLPNYASQGKPNATSFEHRYNMVELAVLRNSRFRLPEKALIERLYRENTPRTWREALQRAIVSQEGADNTFIQICGADSFVKMVENGWLPRPSESRIVAVMARKGYEPVVPKTAVPLVKAGKIRFFDPDVPELSSTRLRDILGKNELPAARELPRFLMRYIQRNLLYGVIRPPVKVPAGYRVLRGSFRTSSDADFDRHPFEEFFPASVLRDSLSLDVDGYLLDKFPLEIQEMILTRGLRVMILGGLLDEALGFLGKQGYQAGTIFIPQDPKRIDLCYILATRGRVPCLVVTNVFGEDRLAHLVIKLGQLLCRNLLPIGGLEIFAVRRYAELDDRLCAGALRCLESDGRTLIVFGYQGALNYMISDLLKYLAVKGSAAYGRITLPELDEFREPLGDSHRLEGEPAGSPEFPYWSYSIPDSKGRLFRIIAFRNLYGDQTQTVLSALIRKGFRQFVMFGNGGGLKDVRVGQILAPVLLIQGNRSLILRNAAARDYPSGIGVTVRSVLEETLPWLESHPESRLVDVENVYAARALKLSSGVSLYSGVLVSDLPGRTDITKRNEDSKEFLATKRQFFFRLLKRIITGDFTTFPSFHPVSGVSSFSGFPANSAIPALQAIQAVPAIQAAPRASVVIHTR